MQLRPMDPEAEPLPVIVPGLEVHPLNQRMNDGSYEFSLPLMGQRMVLLVLPRAQGGTALEPRMEQLIVANEFQSGFYPIDSNRAYVPLELLQGMMNLDAAPIGRLDPVTGEQVISGYSKPRVSEIHIAAREDVTPEQLRDHVEQLYNELRNSDDWPDLHGFMTISTWQDRTRNFISGIEKAKGLMLILFGIVSAVAILLIGVVFYILVIEKTRDIGIMRSLGASATGVAGIFVGFGALLGMVGTALGIGLAYLVVTNINAIHMWLGEGFGSTVVMAGGAAAGTLVGGSITLALAGRLRKPHEDRSGDVAIDMIVGAIIGTLLGAFVGTIIGSALGVRARYRGRVLLGMLGGLILGTLGGWAVLHFFDSFRTWINDVISIVIWDRSKYYFDAIPNQMDWQLTVWLTVIAIAASAVGALIPSVLAARVDPVQSLRYE